MCITRDMPLEDLIDYVAVVFPTVLCIPIVCGNGFSFEYMVYIDEPKRRTVLGIGDTEKDAWYFASKHNSICARA